MSGASVGKIMPCLIHQQEWLLKELARLLESTVRSTDIIARYGGEEFIILSPKAKIK